MHQVCFDPFLSLFKLQNYCSEGRAPLSWINKMTSYKKSGSFGAAFQFYWFENIRRRYSRISHFSR
jgi:hypothetical protein